MKLLKRLLPAGALALVIAAGMLFGLDSSGNYAVNPLYGVCLMARDELYVCDSLLSDESELPDDLEYVGEIETFVGGLPGNNMEANDNDHGTQLYLEPELPERLYAYDSYREQYWIYLRCDIGVVFNGMLYISYPSSKSPEPFTVSSLPEDCSSAGEIRGSRERGVPVQELEALGLPVGTELYAYSSHRIYARTEQYAAVRYLVLEYMGEI